MNAPVRLQAFPATRLLGNPGQVMWAPGQPRVPSRPAMPLQHPQMTPAWVAGLGEDIDPGQVSEGFGLPPQDLINSLYDIFGSYPRKNVLPYFFSFSLLTATGNALTALGTQRPSIKITADAAMISTLFTGASTGEYSIFMRTDSSDRQLMQFPVHSASIVGTAERPFVLPKPLLLAPNTTLSFDITDLSNATNEVWFTLAGFKVYRRQYAAAG